MLKKLIALALILSIFIPFGFVRAANDNLVSQAVVGAGGEVPWAIFGTGKASLEQITTKDGKKEPVLKTTGLGENTWSSPSFDIFKIIKQDVEKNGAGRYAISFNIMLDGKAGKEYSLSLLVRASNKTALFNAGDGGVAGFRTSIGNIKALTGQWKSFSTTFGVSKEDVQGDETWKLCLDSLPEDLHTVWLGDFSVIRFSDDATPEVKNVLCVDNDKYTSQSSKTETSKGNLLDKKTSSFDGVKNWQESGWVGFSAGKMSLSEDGYSGSCLKMETPPNTWGSPALNVFPYINGAGEYTVSMFVKYDGEGTEELKLFIRGTRANSFIEKQGNNHYVSIGVKTFKAGEWAKITAKITVTEDDLKETDEWRLCFSKIESRIKALYIDEVVLIKGGIADLPEAPEPNETVQLQQAEEKEIPQLYDPNIKKAAIVTAIRTLIVVVVVILLKIFLPKVFKKGVKK